MPKQKRRLKKKKQRERLAKQRVLDRRTSLREENKLKKEIERIQWDNRERIIPIRNPKNESEKH